jgi:glycosyltransferase involved in cell wall biosynthesis
MSVVSVFVPAYNYAHFLPECVDSVLTQAGVDVRVLVIDDASTDGTPEIAGELVRTDPRIEYVRHAANRGHIATYNEGIAWADGDYVVLLSADDMLTPGALARATAVLDSHPGAAFAYGKAVRFHTAHSLPPVRRQAKGGRTHVYRGEDWIESVCRGGRNFIAAPEVVVRTSVQKAAGGYQPTLPRTADLEMWLRLASRGEVAWIEDSDQAYYRQHTENMHKTRLTTALEVNEQRIAAFDTFFREQGSRLAEADRLQRMAHDSIAKAMLATACRALDDGETVVSGTPVTDLVVLANSMSPVERTREYRALAWRLRVGPGVSRYAGRAAAMATLRYPRAWYRARMASQSPL